MDVSNIYTAIPEELHNELFGEVLKSNAFTLERIVSRGHATPEGEWYDQERNEWVMLLKGGARLRIEGEDEAITLKPGDYIILPAHLKHRVEWTTPGEDTVWLALRY